MIEEIKLLYAKDRKLAIQVAKALGYKINKKTKTTSEVDKKRIKVLLDRINDTSKRLEVDLKDLEKIIRDEDRNIANDIKVFYKSLRPSVVDIVNYIKTFFS